MLLNNNTKSLALAGGFCYNNIRKKGKEKKDKR